MSSQQETRSAELEQEKRTLCGKPSPAFAKSSQDEASLLQALSALNRGLEGAAQKIARLEEENYFLQHKVDQLSSDLTHLQLQQEKAEKSFSALAQLLEAMREKQELSEKDLIANERPPHYDSW